MSSSSSSSATTDVVEDRRAGAEGEGVAISSSGGNVTVHQVPDEAFEMGLEALREMRDLASSSITNSGMSLDIVADTLGQALATTQENAKTEEGQLSAQIIKIGIPAAALAYVAARIWK